MSNEVALKQTNAVALDVVDDLFEGLEIDSSDILIPKLLLMQPSSQLVGEEKAQIGEFRDSVSGDKLGSIVDPIVIVPFHFRKSWDIMNADDNNSWLRNEPFTPANALLPWTDKVDGMNIKRIKRLDFFCMVPAQLEKGKVLPMVVSFKSTGYKSGSVILSNWQEARTKVQQLKEQALANPKLAADILAQAKPYFSTSFVLSGNKFKNEKNQIYCVPSIQVGAEVPVEVQKLCLQWLHTVKTAKNIVVDTSDEKEVASAPVSDEGVGSF
jgi:hypothetical protein